MGFAHTISNQEGIYFITITVEQWIDVFTKKEYVDILIESLCFCQRKKGLQIYAWVIMSNHLHLIIACTGQNRLSDIIRDFKKFTSRKIVKAIESNLTESRKIWLLSLLKRKTPGGKMEIEFWQNGYHAEEIFSGWFFHQKMEYIHHNPVEAGYARVPEHYPWSSAGDFYGMPGPIVLTYENG